MLRAYDTALMPLTSGAHAVSPVRKQAQPDRKSLLGTAAELDPSADPSEPKLCSFPFLTTSLSCVGWRVFNAAGELEARLSECRRKGWKAVFSVQCGVDVELESKGAPS